MIGHEEIKMESEKDKEWALFILCKLNNMLYCTTFDGMENKVIDLIKELTEEYLPGRTVVIAPGGIEKIVVPWTCPACEKFNEYDGGSEDMNWNDICENCKLEVELRQN